MAIHLGRRLPAASCSLPGSRNEPELAHAPCLALHRVGFAEPGESPRLLVRSYRTVSPLLEKLLAISQNPIG